MSRKENCPPPTLAAGDRRHGFLIRRIEQIPEIRVTAYEIEHEKTGAKILHLHCDDRENLFSIGFRTPPRDSTGVPHILEHSVLAGSERYPLKDVFNELLQGTLQTFINAFTYPDKTDLSRRQPGEARFLQPRPGLYRPGPPAAAPEGNLPPGRPPPRIRRRRRDLTYRASSTTR